MGNRGELSGGPVKHLVAHPARLLPTLLATVALAGCDFRLVEVEQSAPTRLGLHVMSEGSSRLVGGSGSFYPGLGGDGEILRLSGEQLWVNDHAVAPELSDAGVRRYELPEVIIRPGSDPLRIRPPTVPARPSGPTEITVPPLQLEAPDTVVAARSEVVRIGLSGYDHGDAGGGIVVPGLEVGRIRGIWVVEARPDSAGIAAGAEPVTIMARGPPPPSLLFPIDLLAPAFQKGVHPCEPRSRHPLSLVRHGVPRRCRKRGRG